MSFLFARFFVLCFGPMLVLSFLLSFSVFASEVPEAYSWIVQDINHPLWTALPNVRTHKVSQDVYLKELPGLQCIKTIQPFKTDCKILIGIAPKSAFRIYENLKVAETHTNADHVKAKVLGPLIVRADLTRAIDEEHWRYNLSKVYFNHPCQYVHDRKQAKRCIGFWSHKIFVSYEDWNKVDMVDIFKVKETVPMVAELLSDKEEAHRIQDLINQFDFFAGMIESQGQLNMHYLGMKLGADAIPVIIQSVDIEDLPRVVRRQLSERQQKEKVPVDELITQFKAQMDDFADKIILRSTSEDFQKFKATLLTDLEKEFQEAQ